MKMNATLDDYVFVDYYRLKLLKHLEKLVEEEFRLGNYGETHRRAIQYLRLYKRVVKEYSDYSIVKDPNYIVVKNASDSDITTPLLKYLKPSRIDNVIQKVMDSRRFLVSKPTQRLIWEINLYLPAFAQWDAFSTFDEIVLADNGLGESNYRQTLLNRIQHSEQKLADYLQKTGQGKTLKNYKRNDIISS